MKSAFRILPLITLALLLMACDWFYHPVTYNGKREKGNLVVTADLQEGTYPQIYVNKSFFFLDSTAYVRNNYSKQLNPAYVRDADVRLIINGNTPIQLHGEERIVPNTQQTNNADIYLTKYVYTCDYVLQAGDVVELSVKVPEFKQIAYAKQVIPMPIVAQLTEVAVGQNPYVSYSDLYDLAKLTLQISSYQGDANDKLCFIGKSYEHRIYTQYSKKDASIIKSDTTYYVSSMTYSNNVVFSMGGNLNLALSKSFYGSDKGIYCTPLQEETTLDVWVQYRPTKRDSNYYAISEIIIDSVVVEIQAISPDAYTFRSSYVAAEYTYLKAHDYWGGEDSDLYDFTEIIEDMFDELGTLERVQLYSNVENALGQVVSRTTTSFTITGDKLKTVPENTSPQ
ncbi:MAG: DUF4249 domain-containing protein [Paludibacter sp.]|nr:DUF4249 domain-containing protein [Bacteroidales bacterium]MCM1069900.1 DUF4249 domain-containing protein [Prevotella sp.]MCM1354581.1 DUF4249 domain-containing protein [Bacteroides sp.]MCM1443476.1 DUF4249 domain-containing protein [Muribaculum sp.]MCM1482560.1 DUF4249 domain-containing protein [Paludibacter sp.]